MADDRGGLARFGHLEIGTAKLPPSEPKAKPSPKPASTEITLVIDGITYRSDDPTVPPDVRALMERIAKDGYSNELVEDWKNSRAPSQNERQSELLFANKAEDPESGDGVFKGDRVSVIRLDGKVYTSDDPDLKPEIKELFYHLDAYGATPDLMEKLRALGGKVTVHPANTASPTDGDIEFWREVVAANARRRTEGRPVDEWDKAFYATAAVAALAVWYVYTRFIWLHLLPVAGLAAYAVSLAYLKRAAARARSEPGAASQAAHAEAESYHDAVLRVIGGGRVGPFILLMLAAILFMYVKVER